jgi:hypothetical protein
LRDEKPVPKSSMAKLIAQGLADQVNLTDEESRIMPVAGGGFEQCYNAQAVVAEGSLLVVAVGVVQAANDKQQLEPMLNQRRDMTPPSNFALRIIVEEDPKLVRTLNARYADAAADGGLEAVEKILCSMSLPDISPDDLCTEGMPILTCAYRPRTGTLASPYR